MKRCGGCGKQIRSGSMVYIGDGKGGIVRKRLGPCCAAKSVPLLLQGIKGGLCKCGDVATSCIGCARKGEKRETVDVVAAAVKKLKGIVAARKRQSQFAPARLGEEDNVSAGLEQAIDILTAGDF